MSMTEPAHDLPMLQRLATALLHEARGDVHQARALVKALAASRDPLGRPQEWDFPRAYLLRAAARLDPEAFLRICERASVHPTKVLDLLVVVGHVEVARRYVLAAGDRDRFDLASRRVRLLAARGRLEEAFLACEDVESRRARVESLLHVLSRDAAHSVAPRCEERILALAADLNPAHAAAVLLDLALSSNDDAAARILTGATMRDPPATVLMRKAVLQARLGRRRAAARSLRRVRRQITGKAERWKLANAMAEAGFPKAAFAVAAWCASFEMTPVRIWHPSWEGEFNELHSMATACVARGQRRLALRLCLLMRDIARRPGFGSSLPWLRMIADLQLTAGADAAARRTPLHALVRELGRRELEVEGGLRCAAHYLRASRADRARPCVKRALRAATRSSAWVELPDTLTRLAHTACDAGYFREALRVARGVSPDCLNEIRLRVAIAHARRGRPARLLQACASLQGRGLLLDHSLRTLIDIGLGHEAYRLASERDASADTWCSMAETHARRGDHEQAAICLLEWLTRRPRSHL